MPNNNDNPVQSGTGSISSCHDCPSATQSTASTSSITAQQPLHQRQLTSRYGIPLKRYNSLNSTTSSTTNGTLPTHRGGSIKSSSSSGGSMSQGKMSVDDILSTKSMSARKTRVKDESKRNNAKLIKSASKKPKSKFMGGGSSPSKYNFPSREECLIRLGSPAKAANLGLVRTPLNKSVKRDVLSVADEINESAINQKKEHVNVKGKRSSPRLAKKSGASDSNKVTPDDIDCESSKTSSIEIAASESKMPHPPPTESASDLVSNLLDAYSACLEGEKTPWEVVQLFPPILNYLDTKESNDGNTIIEGLGQFVKSVESTREEVINRNTSNNDDISKQNEVKPEERLLRQLQIQIWIRMMVWNFNREEGWGLLRRVLEYNLKNEKTPKSKGKRKRGKKSKMEPLGPSESFVRDVILLFELAPYVLPPSLEFSKWLKNTLTFGFQQSLPEFGIEVLDHFEVEFVNGGLDKDEIGASQRVNRVSNVKTQSSTLDLADSKMKPVGKGKAHQQAYFSSLARNPLSVNTDGESATIGSEATFAARSVGTSTASTKTSAQSDKEADATLFKTSVSLTAAVPQKKKNPFLKDSARGVYVGSHFNSKLSNISSLFREVKAPPKPKPEVITAKRKDPPEQSIATPSISTKTPINKTSSVQAFINKKYNYSHPPSETPRKRLKPAPSHNFNNFPQVNDVAATPLQVIDETPAKQPRPSARSNISRSANNNFTIGATPLQIIGETPAKKPRTAARRLKPNALDGIFVRHSTEMTPRQNSGGLCFGLSPMPQQRRESKLAPKDGKKWN